MEQLTWQPRLAAYLDMLQDKSKNAVKPSPDGVKGRNS